MGQSGFAMRVTIILSFLLNLLVTPVQSHELWIEPDLYLVEPDTVVTARLVNGQNFDGLTIRYFPKDFVRFTLSLGDNELPVPGRVGDTPALNMPALGNGLHIATFQSSGDLVNYSDLEKFARFVDHKDLASSLGTDVLARHAARNLPTADFYEYYTRYSKALIGVGDAAGADRRMGLETELVALQNPYTDDLSAGIDVQLFWSDTPRADAQIELFAKAPDGSVTVTLHRTDATGVVRLPVTPGYSYLVDAVILREPTVAKVGERDVAWESLWAALTFAVPD
jgi:Domain of unknown function (DUF4198)